MPQITDLDHFVLTATDLPATIAFYTQALGMRLESFVTPSGQTRQALLFGNRKINLHAAAGPFAPHAARPTPGALDLCLLTNSSLATWQTHLAERDVKIVEGPVPRTGAKGPITSIYIRDPDGNLIEISTYADQVQGEQVRLSR